MSTIYRIAITTPEALREGDKVFIGGVYAYTVFRNPETIDSETVLVWITYPDGGRQSRLFSVPSDWNTRMVVVER